MKVRTLHLRWASTTAAALVCFAVLVWLDTLLKRQTGFGTVDLQKVATARDFNIIFDRWLTRDHAAIAGFNLGFDYLFMPLYGFAFYYAGLVARDAFFGKSGVLRRLFTLLAAVPLAGAIADAVENGLETWMLVAGATDPLAMLAFAATNAKMVCFYVGLLLLVLAIAGRFRRARAQSA